MFGMNDDSQQSNDDPAMLDNVKQLVSEPADQVVPPTLPQYMTAAPATTANPAASTSDPYQTSAPSSDTTSTVPSEPVTDNSSTTNSNSDTPFSMPAAANVAEPAQGFSSSPMPEPAIETPSEPVNDSTSDPAPFTLPVPSTTDDSSSSSTSEDTSDNAPIAAATVAPADPEHLAGMKQEALGHLEPLVEHLDGTAEETFKTTMMMIQANDNHTLLEKALDAAKKIEDDKVRAQAMLDIVNEINYFSQNQ